MIFLDLVKNFVKYFIIFLVNVLVVFLIGFAIWLFILWKNLPSIDLIVTPEESLPSKIYLDNGEKLGEFAKKRLDVIEFDELPEDLVNAFLVAEDLRFFEHKGLDIKGLFRVLYKFIKFGEVTGASTITMQMVKNYLLSFDRNIVRKLKEIMLALKVESVLSKEKIFELYINKIFFGFRNFGINAAVDFYYDISIKDLDISQMAMLAAIPKAPSIINPLSDKKAAKERRDWILKRMYNNKKISYISMLKAIDTPLLAKDSSKRKKENIYYKMPYIAELVRSELVSKYGDGIYNQGLEVQTTFNGSLQFFANRAIQQGLINFSLLKQTYAGPTFRLKQNQNLDDSLSKLEEYKVINGLYPVMVLSINQSRIRAISNAGSVINIYIKKNKQIFKNNDSIKVGDIIRVRFAKFIEDIKTYDDCNYYVNKKDCFFQIVNIPKVQGALVALNRFNGNMVANVGGFSYRLNKLNRVYSKLQPGSSFKPVIYLAALEMGYKPYSVLFDLPISFFEKKHDFVWSPDNFDKRWLGKISFRDSLVFSRNSSSVRLMYALGAENVKNYLDKFGFNVNRNRINLSLVLGAYEVSLLDMTKFFTAISNGGYLSNANFIKKVVNSNGEVLLDYKENNLFNNEDLFSSKFEEDNNIDNIIYSDEENLDNFVLNLKNKKQIRSFKGIEPIASKENIYIMYDILLDFFKKGPAREIKFIRDDFGGKTGTTSKSRNTCFIGFGGDIVAGVWVSYDDNKSLGKEAYGINVALPIWQHFMYLYLKNNANINQVFLKKPNNLVRINLDKESLLIVEGNKDNTFPELVDKKDVLEFKNKSILLMSEFLEMF